MCVGRTIKMVFFTLLKRVMIRSASGFSLRMNGGGAERRRICRRLVLFLFSARFATMGEVCRFKNYSYFVAWVFLFVCSLMTCTYVWKFGLNMDLQLNSIRLELWNVLSLPAKNVFPPLFINFPFFEIEFTTKIKEKNLHLCLHFFFFEKSLAL